MTETKPKTTDLAHVGAGAHGLVLNNLEDMKTVSQIILQSKLAPDSFQTSEQIFVGLQAGAEIGLKPMQSLNSIVVIHGKPTLWGDAALALVKRSGLVASFSEKVTGEGDEMCAYVSSVRKAVEVGEGESVVETTFSVADAKTAGLWKKKGPWTTHPKRMLKYKARAFNLRDNFPDVLFGMHLTEEMYGEEPLDPPRSDVPSRDNRRMAVPSTAVDTTRKSVEESKKDPEPGTCEDCGKNIYDGDECANDECSCFGMMVCECHEHDEENKPKTEQVTFVCKECGQTFQYGKEEGAGVRCECGKGTLQIAVEKPVEPERLYVQVFDMYEKMEGKDFIEFAAYVLCLDDNEIVPDQLTDEQFKQIKAYIETNGVAIN
jgi:hypothetical protein